MRPGQRAGLCAAVAVVDVFQDLAALGTPQHLDRAGLWSLGRSARPGRARAAWWRGTVSRCV